MFALKPADECDWLLTLCRQTAGPPRQSGLFQSAPSRSSHGENFMTMRKLVSLMVLMLALTTFGFTQGATTGDLQITVKDPKGSLVPNATVMARDQAKGLERSATGNGQGEYRIVLLPPATYQVTVEAAGFAKTA